MARASIDHGLQNRATHQGRGLQAVAAVCHGSRIGCTQQHCHSSPSFHCDSTSTWRWSCLKLKSPKPHLNGRCSGEFIHNCQTQATSCSCLTLNEGTGYLAVAGMSYCWVQALAAPLPFVAVLFNCRGVGSWVQIIGCTAARTTCRLPRSAPEGRVLSQ